MHLPGEEEEEEEEEEEGEEEGEEEDRDACSQEMIEVNNTEHCHGPTGGVEPLTDLAKVSLKNILFSQFSKAD